MKLLAFSLFLLFSFAFTSNKDKEENKRYILIEAQCKPGFDALPEFKEKVIITKIFKEEFENTWMPALPPKSGHSWTLSHLGSRQHVDIEHRTPLDGPFSRLYKFIYRTHAVMIATKQYMYTQDEEGTW